MRKTGLLAVLLVLVISAATLPSSLDGFLSPYSHGNLHMALNVNPIEVIRLLGREPDSYDYYASSQWLFTYLDASASTGVSGLAFIWEASSVKSIRVFVSGTLSPEGLLRLLGYEPDSLAAPVSGAARRPGTGVPAQAMQR